MTTRTSKAASTLARASIQTTAVAWALATSHAVDLDTDHATVCAAD